MIFVIAEDNMLSICDNEAELQGACEGVDVAEGVYRFFDDSGNPLEAEFYESNKEGKIFGILSWVQSGKYALVPSSNSRHCNLKDMLTTVHGLESNEHFSSIEQVNGFITTRSTQDSR